MAPPSQCCSGRYNKQHNNLKGIFVNIYNKGGSVRHASNYIAAQMFNAGNGAGG